MGEQSKKMLGKDQLEHGIAEKLKSLVIEMMSLSFMAEAGMSKRFG
jgi:hypothetical protein